MHSLGKNMFHKCLSVVLALALMFGATPITAFSTDDTSIIFYDDERILAYEMEVDNDEADSFYSEIPVENDAEASLQSLVEGVDEPVEQEIIYAFSRDSGIQDQEVGTTGAGNPILNDTPYLTGSGSPIFTIVANPDGGNSLQISGRDADWHTFDLVRAALGMDARNIYEVTVAGRILGGRSGAQAQISRTGGSWGPFVSAAPAADGSFVVTLEVDAELHAELASVGGNGFRIRTNGSDDFIIDEITVRLPQGDDVYIPTPGSGTLIPEEITLSPNRVRGFEIADFDVDRSELSWSLSGNVTDDTTIENGFLRIADNNPLGTIVVRAYVTEDPEIYGIAVVTVGGASTSLIHNLPAGLNFDEYPSLREVYEDYFKMGVAGDSGLIAGQTGTANLRGQLIGHHYNSWSFENSMKVQPLRGNNAANRLQPSNQWPGIAGPTNTMNAARARYSEMTFAGHTTAWHSQSPDWMWDRHVGGNADRAIALENMRFHINETFRQFGSQLSSMDVVNEAIGSVNPANPSDWRGALTRGEGWSPTLGYNWVMYAFIFAAEVVDELDLDVTLYYNDFLLHTANKGMAAYSMIREINEMHAAGEIIHPITNEVFRRPDDKLLIEGVGLQDRQSGIIDIDGFSNAINMFAELGLLVSITELDLSWRVTSPDGLLTAEEQIAQGVQMARFFEMIRRYAVGPATAGSPYPRVVERITFWGIDDTHSWAPGEPMLFGRPSGNMIPGKEALRAVIDPFQFLEDHPWIPEELPPVPGVHIFNLEDDGFAGANIILGNDSDIWPFSTAGDDGVVAFTPQPDATYRLLVRYQTFGTYGLEAHWLVDNSADNFTAASAEAALTMGTVTRGSGAGPSANGIPTRFFNPGVGGSFAWLETTFTMPADAQAGDLLGNIALRGINGGNEFGIYSIEITRINPDGDDTLLVNYPFLLPPQRPDIPGIIVPEPNDAQNNGRADIIIGSGRDVWPFADAHESGVAFDAEPDVTYRIMFNMRTTGAGGWRVRWIPGVGGEDYTTADGAVVNSYPLRASSFGLGVPTKQQIPNMPVASFIPSHPNQGVSAAGVYTIVQDITLSADEVYQGLIGNIALRGTGGSGNFVVNWISIQELTAGPGSEVAETLNFWPFGLDAFEDFSADPIEFMQTVEGFTADHFEPNPLNVTNNTLTPITRQGENPTISNEDPPQVGQTLVAGHISGGVGGPAGTLRAGETQAFLAGVANYEWLVNGIIVQTGASNELTLLPAHAGHSVQVRVSSDWETGELTSAETPAVYGTPAIDANIHPETITLRPNRTRGFILVGTEAAAEWSISGAQHSATNIRSTEEGGFLTISPDEPDGIISVIAEIPGQLPITATVTISTESGASIIDDLDRGLPFFNYPALRDVYDDYFLMGSVSGPQINPQAGSNWSNRRAVLAHNYNSVTFGNDMKPEPLRGNDPANRLQEPSQWPGHIRQGAASLNPEQSRSYALDAFPDMVFYGHTAAWHSQSPSWMWDRHDGGTANRDIALENMQHHIRGFFELYGDWIWAADVVNEPFGSVNPNDPYDWRFSLARGEGWYPTLGSDWVTYAFIFAAEIVDELELDTQLYLNEFNLATPLKGTTAYAFIRDVNQMHEDGELVHPITGEIFQRENSKMLIEGIGMQDRASGVMNVENWEASILRFASLGLRIAITELDLSWRISSPDGRLTPAEERDQAIQYARLFELFRKYASGPANAGSPHPRVIDVVTTFALVDDPQGWNPNMPSIFNAPEPYDGPGAIMGYTVTGKYSLLGTLDPHRFLEENPWIPAVLPPVDGVHVFDLENDGFTGMNIILGNDENVWPFSSAADDGLVAFTPIADATYLMRVYYQSLETFGLEAHWIRDNSEDNFTAASILAAEDMSTITRSATAGAMANMIPNRFFNPGVSGSYAWLETTFTLPADAVADGLLGNIALRGYRGEGGISIQTVRIYLLDDEGNPDELLVNYPYQLPLERPVIPGIIVPEPNDTQSNGRADIIIGSGRDVWPYADAHSSGVAFDPEPGVTYRIMFNMRTTGANGWRVRWIPGTGGEDYTTADGAVVNSYPMRVSAFGLGIPTSELIPEAPIASFIPSHPNQGVSAAGVYTVIQDITLCPDEVYQGLIGNIALRGTGGSGNFVVNWISIQELTDGPGSDVEKTLNFWPFGVDAFDDFSEDPVAFMENASGFAADHFTPNVLNVANNSLTPITRQGDNPVIDESNPPLVGDTLVAGRISGGAATGAATGPEGSLRDRTTQAFLAGNAEFEWLVNDEVVHTGNYFTPLLEHVGYPVYLRMTSDWETGELFSVTPVPVEGDLEYPVVPITSLTIYYDGSAADDFTLYLPNAARRLEAVVNPDDATESYEWVSSDPEVALVDETGLVTAISDGVATIYLRVADSEIIRLTRSRLVYDSVVVTVLEEDDDQPITTIPPIPPIPPIPGIPNLPIPPIPPIPGIPSLPIPPIPGIPSIPSLPIPGIPEIPQVPGLPAPGIPGIPQVPSLPAPGIPGIPPIPSLPAPGIPGVPQLPSLPIPTIPPIPTLPGILRMR